jgi:hypothetical protein
VNGWGQEGTMVGGRIEKHWVHWQGECPAPGPVAHYLPQSGETNVEVMLFFMGLKPALKVEDQRPEEVAALTRLAHGLGAAIEVLERTTGPTTAQRDMVADDKRTMQVFLARDPAAIPLLLEMERRERRGGSQRRRAIARSGDLLGYPPCCVRFFLTLEQQDDDHVIAEYRKQGPFAQTDALFNIFPPMVSPLTWYPCSFHCQASRAKVGEALARLHMLSPSGMERDEILRGVTLVFGRFLFVHLRHAHFDGEWICYSEVSDALSFTADPLFVDAPPLVGFRQQLTERLGAGRALRLREALLSVRMADGSVREATLAQAPMVFRFGG